MIGKGREFPRQEVERSKRDEVEREGRREGGPKRRKRATSESGGGGGGGKVRVGELQLAGVGDVVGWEAADAVSRDDARSRAPRGQCAFSLIPHASRKLPSDSTVCSKLIGQFQE